MKKTNLLLWIAICIYAPLFMGAFDKDKPAASTSLRSSNPEILANWTALQAAINNEHIFSGTSAGTQTGDHTQGSARCFSQSSAPATRIDGDGFLSTDLGSLWVDTDDNAVYVLTATTPTWTPVSTEIIATLLAAGRVFASTLGVDGNFTVNSNFDVTAASGNTLVGGTFESTGIATLADASTLKTNAAPSSGSAEIANAKYVDDQITANAVDSDALCKAWVTHNSSGVKQGTGFNITSTARNGTGDYTVTWDTNFADTNYAVSINSHTVTSEGTFCSIKTKAVGSVRYTVTNRAGSNLDFACDVIAFGTQ